MLTKWKRLDEIQALEGQNASTRQQTEKAYAVLAINSNLKFVVGKLAAFEQRVFQMESQIAQGCKRRTLIGESAALSQSKDEVQALISALQSLSGKQTSTSFAPAVSGLRMRNRFLLININPSGNRSHTHSNE